MASYDTFGTLYDLVVGERPELAHFLVSQIQYRIPGARTILELGCGSGSILKVLTKDFECTGIDISPKMIDLAKVKAPAANCFVADITTFRSKQQFDAVLCVFDTMNHLPRFNDWKNVFRTAALHMAPGGMFIFDVNTAYKLDRYHEEPAAAGFHGDSTSIVNVVRKRKNRYEVQLRVFSPAPGAGTYSLHELIIPELTVPVKEISQEARRHFSRVKIIDTNRRRPSAYSEELFFICRK